MKTEWISGVDADFSSINGEYVPADVAQGLYDALFRITNAGSWYHSALEIDVYEHGSMDGEELERMALEALAAADGEEV